MIRTKARAKALLPNLPQGFLIGPNLQPGNGNRTCNALTHKVRLLVGNMLDI
ncbi:MAG: hypothetical protein KGZ70_11980 [Hydrogenophaga sp.]|uniref:hypothetical protein n=1 Tax=Hydrogenophaga sp. TaxID=1904254 RepID=UPI001BBD12CF|nr:hypothetical protein [Hydrogenophaga sp.]MBS3912514.1 hypothetical protein [Hydrogenophaga sp.]MDO9147248.1 hypothetical protein [Hydrogenophaga sp.]MDO9604850.1 hypothetical protein [Hydrogenophaga sp.]MDP2164532.1 hypothetical protein [Hydrogenophaga sp.]MDP3477350.1 hypothetical protein [Hydrogenophaga sp.]